MKKATVVIVLFGMSLGLVLMSGFAAAAGGVNPAEVEKRVVVIPGNQAWTNAGVRLRPQDRVTITATGTVCFSEGDAQSGVDPRGWTVATYCDDWPGDFLQCDDPLPTANHASLIGNVGSDVVYVGTRLVFWGVDGFLYLGINDCSFTGSFYNTGQFEAVITVERGAVTLKPKEGAKAGVAGPQPLITGKKK